MRFTRHSAILPDVNVVSSDHRPELRYTLLTQGQGTGRRWQFDLLGAPIEPMDRQYLPTGAARPLLTGFGWCMRLQLQTPSRHPAPSPYEVSVTMESSAALGVNEPRTTSRRFLGPSMGTERRVLWTLIQLDRAAQDRLDEVYVDEPRTDQMLIASDSHVARISSSTHIITRWQPHWRAPRFRRRAVGGYIELDARMKPVRIQPLGREAPGSTPLGGHCVSSPRDGRESTVPVG